MSPDTAHNLKNYLTVKQAAAFLGVAPNTMRSWDAAGKLRARRNPVNGYRLYLRADLETFLAAVDETTHTTPPNGQSTGGDR